MSAPANQHSVIHFVSPFIILGPLNLTQSSCKRILPAARQRVKSCRHKGRPGNALAFAEGSVAVPMVPDANGASCKGSQSSAHALDFFWREITSTLANQYSVLVIHAFLLFRHFGFR
jgi:hypothetical protein